MGADGEQSITQALAPRSHPHNVTTPHGTRSLSSACTTWHDARQVEAGLGKALEKAYEAVGPPEVTGLLSVRAYVESDGSVSKIDTLVDTLVADPGLVDGDVSLDEARSGVVERISKELLEAKFEACDEPTQITIPFTFD